MRMCVNMLERVRIICVFHAFSICRLKARMASESNEIMLMGMVKKLMGEKAKLQSDLIGWQNQSGELQKLINQLQEKIRTLESQKELLWAQSLSNQSSRQQQFHPPFWPQQQTPQQGQREQYQTPIGPPSGPQQQTPQQVQGEQCQTPTEPQPCPQAQTQQESQQSHAWRAQPVDEAVDLTGEEDNGQDRGRNRDRRGRRGRVGKEMEREAGTQKEKEKKQE